jgi:N,N'-diacetyllegionaminate synthase
MIFIAEIGLNHNGNIDLCYELIKQAKYSGADIAKFQYGWKSGKNEINHLTIKDVRKLKSICDYFEIEILFSVFNKESYKNLKNIGTKKFKIASRILLDDLELAKSISKDKENETIVSMGMVNLNTRPLGNSKKIKYLWCRSRYPTFLEDLKKFPRDFKKSNFHGYSDHCIGIETCLLAISRGAKIIEKHFTLDKSDTTIRDHSLSATPDEFLNLTRVGRDIGKKIESGI